MTRHWLATFDAGQGSRPGLVVADKIVDIGPTLGLPPRADMMDVLERWKTNRGRLSALADDASANWLSLADVTLKAPIERPLAIYCAGANYRDHVDNMARARGVPTEPDPHEAGLDPWHFLKSGRTIAGPEANVVLDCERLDWEAELAAVIGEPARHVSVAEALNHVAGYMIANDLSARDRMARRNGTPGTTFYYDWIGHKSFEGSCPIGPYILPADFVADPQDVGIKLWVNDRLRQDSNTCHMLFSIAEQIARLSTYVTLHPGDIILTGTPGGVGAETGESLCRGDVVRIAIEEMGEQRITIV
ncbi:MAG: fumarylacetoacetate hydrolase family protein [Mesorhizobium sp.]|nr:fumarylacetoacetate hydrolase family protein [Mesorhizobium sp.]MCO5160207.1 fumarylacetoacetate hydrolase family protein [Mesorhizobium sp.]